jgi:hypothetical protein
MRTRWLLAIALAPMLACAQTGPLVVHEWGTFTSLQDEAGQTIGGINTDDEPVPSFCHDLGHFLIGRPAEAPPVQSKGVPLCLPDVTMRLETPVVYFHLPKNTPAPVKASVKVAFKGGWLTQFYPAAESGGFSLAARLNQNSVGQLAWNNLTIGVDARGPETTDKVWTAPRTVEAASVAGTNGESEKFLFYRGVGHLLCPLQVRRTADGKTLQGMAQLGGDLANCSPMQVRHLWLASFASDGQCAFRALPAVTLQPERGGQKPSTLFSTAADFTPKEYSPANLPALRREMVLALKEEGLFQDEAEALLNTWQASYFKSGGLRLFFTVPRAWTDNYLPLEVSSSCEISRAMIGRLELITPAQRALLKQLAQAPAPTKPWATYRSTADSYVLDGSMPEAYRNLGRFRQALVLAENHSHPSRSLTAFLKVNGLESMR